jgi:hypothetical protein
MNFGIFFLWFLMYSVYQVMLCLVGTYFIMHMAISICIRHPSSVGQLFVFLVSHNYNVV